MFDLIDRVTKETRKFCILNDRTKNNLLPLVKNNVIPNNENSFEDEENMDIDEEYLINKRIYSDCYFSYQVNDFINMGYILKRFNRSVWFGYGSFHTNNIEGLWSQIKRLTKLITYVLFLRNIERNKLSKNDSIKYLVNFIKVNP